MSNRVLDTHDLAVVVRGDMYVIGRADELDDSPVNIVETGLTFREAYLICSDNNYRPLSQKRDLGN